MSDTKTDAPRKEDEKEVEATAAGGGRLAGLAAKFLTRKSLGILLAISLSVHVLSLAVYKLGGRRSVRDQAAEMPLGDFRFLAAEPRPGQVAEASFALHLALLDEVSSLAQQRLASRAFRVEQGVEELLRRAHGSDFDDPVLAELKRQIQEQINRTVELRAIADVIITDLEVRRLDEEPAAIRVTGSAEPVPWSEPDPSGDLQAASPDRQHVVHQ